MKKKGLLAFVGVLLLAAALGGIKFLQIQRMIAQGNSFAPPPATVTTASVTSAKWEQRLTAVGSLEAVQGVTVAAELSGKINRIAFEPGVHVAAGDLLVQQDTSSEEAQLRSDQASLALKKANYDRARELLAQKVVTQAAYDQARAEYEQARAAIDNVRSIIAKKTIRAPFAGRLGIRLVNLGQILEAGQAIVSLQALDPIFVNFQLPQQQIGRIRPGFPIRITADALPGDGIEGRITAINPYVDEETRNLGIQATVDNRQEHLRPGMFADVAVLLPQENQVMVIPTTAVLYAPYGDSVFIVEEAPAEGEAPAGPALRQQFVRLGDQRGDYVAVRSGLEKGDAVVSTGVFKYRNGQRVRVDNSLSPEFSLSPEPRDR